MLMGCVCASDNNDTVLETEYTVTGSSGSDIQNLIDTANPGDTINLGENKVYNTTDTSISITKSINIKGNNVNIYSKNTNNAFTVQYASDVSISGLNFINSQELPSYGNTSLSGKAILTRGVSNLIVDNCKFVNYEYGLDMYSTSGATIKNSWFNGVITSISGYTGTGTKAIQLMGSKNINIINNTFYGKLYDGLSIAEGSGTVLVENNTFINNTFAIFYGGASTTGNKIKNNRFITCGMLNETYTYYNPLKKANETVTEDIENLPFIGLQKSSNNIEITGNEFVVKNNNMIIYSESENTAHGFPSSIGGITITDNTVIKDSPDVIDSSVMFYYLKIVSSLSINTIDTIVLKDNNFTDIPDIDNFHIEFGSITVNGSDVTIPKAKLSTFLSVVYANDGRVVVELCDVSGDTLSGEKISYYANSVRGSATTDEYGHIYINNLEGLVKLDVTYTGSSQYTASTLESSIRLGNVQTATSITAGNLNVAAADAKTSVFKTTLKDASGNTLAGKSVIITFNGKIYTATSDSNGVVSFKLSTNVAGKYSTTIAFTGDSTYKGSVSVSTIIISKQATKLSVVKKTFKKSATKKVTAVLKDNAGKVIKGKKVTMKVNGKTYTAKTNSKGVATFSVKLTKKGTFKATTKFAGDAYYTLKTVTSKIIVK